MDWYEKRVKELGYKGCRNCMHQIEPLRTCKWAEQGGDGKVHLICPKWEKKGEANEIKAIWLWGYEVRCSNCNFKLETTGLPPICPNCGADMRGDANDLFYKADRPVQNNVFGQ